jgi:hypothetical protein
MNLFRQILTGPSSDSAAARSARDLAPLNREETRPDVIAQLESLDDVIFAAIDGDPAALQESGTAWQRAVEELGQDTIEETRRQYLRHAQSVWENLRRQKTQPPHKIFAAIEIIGLLVNAERT